MRLLVTGGAGFIGSNFIRYWLTNHPEDEVVNFDLLTYAGNLESLKDLVNNPKYKFIQGDIRDVGAVAKVLFGVERVVHFAAESHVDRSITGPAEFVTTNVVGTQVLLDQALKAGVKRFHHVSTDEVFGALPLDTREKFTEHTPYKPNSPYSASKAGSDHLVRAYHKTFGFPTTITNTSNNYGPYHFPEKVIPRMIIRGMLGLTLPVYGEGKNVRDWLHVEDHCRAIEAVLQKGAAGETYLVGGEAELSNLELAKRICAGLGLAEDKIEFVTDRPGHDLRYAIDNSKIERELGWRPLHDFDTWLAKTIAWYKNNEWWWRPLLQKAEIEKGNITLK